MNELGCILVVDSNLVYNVKLCNPVAVTLLSGGGDKKAGVARCHLKQAKLSSVSGIAFIALEVVVITETDQSTLRVLHVHPSKGDAAYTLQGIGPSKGDSDDSDDNGGGHLELERPCAIATITRLGAVEGNEAPFAYVAVAEHDRTELLILKITQNASSRTKPYTVTRAVRIRLGGMSAGLARPLRGVAAMPIGRVGIGVMREERDKAVKEAGNDAAGVRQARTHFQQRSKTCSFVYMTARGTLESSVLEVDVASVLSSGAVIRGATRRSDGSQVIELAAGLVTSLPSAAAGPITIDVALNVYARQGRKIVKCTKGSDGQWSTTDFAGSNTPLAPGSHPKDGVSEHATYGSIEGIAAFPCGQTLFALDGIQLSLSKITNLDGLRKWAMYWATYYECFGLRAWKDDGAVKLWGEMLPDLEACAKELDDMHQRSLDRFGFNFIQGPQLGMSTISLRAQTRTSVQSMRSAYEFIRNLDPEVAALLDARVATEMEAELWWALVSRSVLLE